MIVFPGLASAPQWSDHDYQEEYPRHRQGFEAVDGLGTENALGSDDQDYSRDADLSV
ncbi:MAG: hypothetical protein ACR2JB_24390 [Bryobacteraceae bacterium]